MKRLFILAAATAATTFAAVAPAPAQQWRWNERGWRTIGYARVDGRDSDTIYAPGVSRQREIRLCALNAPLRLRDFDVRFANGGRQDINTRAVDLRGNRRDIQSVRLRYEPIRRALYRPIVRIQVR